MTIPKPEHLFRQADAMSAPGPGARRQTDLRRAVSSVYYGLFHFTMTALADEFVGRGNRHQGRYALVYRGVDHRTLRSVCSEVRKASTSPRYLPCLPATGVDTRVQRFASTVVGLQEQRHQADYDPMLRLTPGDAQAATAAARSAVAAFTGINPDQRRSFLTLLLCPPR